MTIEQRRNDKSKQDVVARSTAAKIETSPSERDSSSEVGQWLSQIDKLISVGVCENRDESYTPTPQDYKRAEQQAYKLQRIIATPPAEVSAAARARIINILKTILTPDGALEGRCQFMKDLDILSFRHPLDVDFNLQDMIVAALIDNLSQPSESEKAELTALFSQDLLKVRVDLGYTYFTLKAEGDWQPRGESAFCFYDDSILEYQSTTTSEPVYERLMASRKRLFKVCFPHNTVETQKQMDALLDWVERADEAYVYRQKLGELLRSNVKLLPYVLDRLQHLFNHHPVALRRELAWSIIRRIDLGDVPVNGGILDYANNSYRLAKNGEVSVARRLTTDGKVALFNDDQRLQGYIQMQPTDGRIVDATINTIEDEDLFLLPELRDDTLGKEREHIKDKYHEGIYAFMHEKFFDETGIYPADLSIREQAALIAHLGEDLNTLDIHSVHEVFRLYKHVGIDMAKALVTVKSFSSERAKEVQLVASSLMYPKEVFCEYAKLLNFAQQFCQIVAPFMENKLGSAFDREAWTAESAEATDGYLKTIIEICKKHYEYHDIPITEKGTLKNKRVRRERTQTSDFYNTEFSTGSALSETDLRAELSRYPEASSHASYEAVIQKIAVDLANQFEAEEIRGLLHDLPEHISHLLVPYLQPETPGRAKEDLKKLYESIRFEEYALNQKMTPKELARLHPWLSKSGPTLDAGCGTGRLLLPLSEQGFDMYGLDYAPRHVRLVQDQLAAIGKDPTRVKEGNWLETEYPDHTFAAVTCLGRNILHEYRLERQKQFFAEMNRVLKMGGHLILDIPDASIPNSHYHELVTGYEQAMHKRGIKRTRHGTIFDSPDDKNFATRYTYSELEIRRFAKEAGFAVERVEREDLPTGQNDQNLYCVLRKIEDVNMNARSPIMAEAA